VGGPHSAPVPHALPLLESTSPLFGHPLWPARPPRARPEAGVLVSATRMDTLAPWHEREGKLPWALEPPAASSRLRGERSLSDQKRRGGERLEPPPGVFSRLPPSPRRRGGRKGKAGVGPPVSTSVPAGPCPQQRPGWLSGPPGTGRRGGAHPSTAGLGAPQQTPRTRARSGQGKVGPWTTPF